MQRTMSGVVVSDAMQKTIIVKVVGTRVHSKYHKRYSVSRRYAVHDEENHYHVGDTVTFVECRPMSKQKRWRVTEPSQKE